MEQKGRLKEITNPSALVTLSYSGRNASAIPEIALFKNLTELDLSENELSEPVPEIKLLRFLRRLNLSHNGINSAWDLPKAIEHLNISYNLMDYIPNTILTLPRLHTLDVSNNRIVSLENVSSIKSLKCLFAHNNFITSLDGVEFLSQLLELDLENNELNSASELKEICSNSSFAVVNIQGNPVQRKILSSKIFNTYSETLSSFDLSQLEEGIMYRHPEKLNQLKTSRFRDRLKSRGNEDELRALVASPEWGYSRRTICNSSPDRNQRAEVRDQMQQDKIELQEQEILYLQQENKNLNTRLEKANWYKKTLRQAQTEFQTLKQQNENLVKQISRIEKKLYNQNSSGVFFDKLVAACGLDNEITSSKHAYKLVKRKALGIQRNNRQDMRIADLESRLAGSVETKRRLARIVQENSVLTKKVQKLKSVSENLNKTTRSQHEKLTILKQYNTELQAKFATNNNENSYLKSENEALKGELSESSKGFMDKIRDLEMTNENLTKTLTLSARRLNLSFDCDVLNNSKVENRPGNFNNSSMLDMSYWKTTKGSGKVLINKKVGTYIQRLKEKISKLFNKVGNMRTQRDNFKMQLINCTQLLGSIDKNCN